MKSQQRDGGTGVPYQLQYALQPPGSDKALWIEDIGRWFAGADGKPAKAHGVVRVINERHAQEERLTYLSRFDGLTGEMNRFHLTEVLQTTLDQSIAQRGSCGFMLVAVDNLARINESYGFDVADEAIGAVAKRLRAKMRGGDQLGRFSGNKFGVILNNCTPEDMERAAERLIAGVRDDVIRTGAGPVALTVTIGGVTAPRHAANVPEILARAQETLDRAKAKRLGSFQVYRPNIEREALRRENVRAADEIVNALNERRILLAFEPIAETVSRQIAYYECLMRVRRADGSILPASAVIPVAERLGLVRLLDHRVLELLVSEMAAVPALQRQRQRLARLDHRSGLVVDARRAAARQFRRRRAADRRDHRVDGDPRRRRHARLRRPRQGPRLQDRDRRFRFGLHVIPQSAQARRRRAEDRRRLRAEPDALRRRPLVRALAGRARAAARSEDRRRMGAGRAERGAAHRVGLRLSAGRADRSCFGSSGRGAMPSRSIAVARRASRKAARVTSALKTLRHFVRAKARFRRFHGQGLIRAPAVRNGAVPMLSSTRRRRFA